MQVEEMAQQRVMRQFGFLQLIDPPPTENPIPSVVHTYVYSRNFRLCCYILHIYAYIDCPRITPQL
jgi:hypothetical protein